MEKNKIKEREILHNMSNHIYQIIMETMEDNEIITYDKVCESLLNDMIYFLVNRNFIQLKDSNFKGDFHTEIENKILNMAREKIRQTFQDIF